MGATGVANEPFESVADLIAKADRVCGRSIRAIVRSVSQSPENWREKAAALLLPKHKVG